MASVLVTSIYWINTSPYGGYVAGDLVTIYVDDVTYDLEIKKNGGVITSGNQIPERFNVASYDQQYYKSEYYVDVLICEGTDKLKFERITAFPYLVQVTLADHPSCAIATPQVCDLTFNSLPEVTDATTATSFDGQIVVLATSSNAIKYKINADFAYSDGTGQVSGTFTGLGLGNYRIYARDAKNCLAVIGATVRKANTYGVLYVLEYYDIMMGYHHKTEILKKDYSGATTIIKGTEAPTQYNLRGEGERDKFTPILAGELIFNIISETNSQFLSLYTNDPERFRMRHSIDSGAGYGIVFLGKVLTNQYSESYRLPPYDIQVIATDALPSLKDIDFLDSDGNALFGEYKQIVIIAFILSKIGLGLNIRTGCNIYADGMATTAADDPLDQAYIDVTRYYLKTETPSCWDVLQKILDPYGAQIIQWGNYWNVIRLEERTGQFDYREYDDVGIYVSNGTYDPVKSLKRSGMTNRIVWTDQDQLMRINPGFGKIRLLYDLGRKDNILDNGDFSISRSAVYDGAVLPSLDTKALPMVAPNLRGWLVVANEVSVETGYEQLENGNIALTFNVDQVGAYLISDRYLLKTGNADQIKFSVKYSVNPPKYSLHKTEYVRVKFQITYGAYYLLDDGTWTDAEANIVEFLYAADLSKFRTFDVISKGVPGELNTTYLDGQDFNVRVSFAHQNDYDFSSVVVLKALPTAGLPDGYKTQLYNASFTGGPVIQYYELRKSTASADNINIIRPNDYNSSTNPYQWIYGSRSPINTEKYTTKIDYIKTEILSQNSLLPEFATYEQSMENDNDTALNKIIYHGSLSTNATTFSDYALSLVPKTTGQVDFFLNIGPIWQPTITYEYQWQLTQFFTANSADLVYSGYLRGATGNGFTNWMRDSRAESKPLENIYLDMYSAQYNDPWRSIQGGFTGDILFAPIDVMKETMDRDRKYYPISLGIDFKMNQYNAEFLELTSTADGDVDLDDPELDGAGFSTGFSLGFNA